MKQLDYQSYYQAFRSASTTHYFSALFFTRDKRDKVALLYAFVRYVDDIVDEQGDADRLHDFEQSFWKHLEAGGLDKEDGSSYASQLIIDFVNLYKNIGFKKDWLESFFQSMHLDLQGKEYGAIEELERYMYGVAVVIGLMLNKILDVTGPVRYALNFGYAAQYVNILRDIGVDQKLGRTYLPIKEIKRFGLENLSSTEAQRKSKEFKAFMQFQIQRARQYIKIGAQGIEYYPGRSKLPFQMLIRSYDWLLKKLEHDPMSVYNKQIKPSKLKMLQFLLSSTFLMTIDSSYEISSAKQRDVLTNNKKRSA